MLNHSRAAAFSKTIEIDNIYMIQKMHHKTKNNKVKWYHDFAGTLYLHKNKKNTPNIHKTI